MCQQGGCSLKGVDTRRCASKEVVPQMGVDTRRCTSKDAGPWRGWIWSRSHIDCRKERVPTRTHGPWRGVDCDISRWLVRRTKHLYKGIRGSIWWGSHIDCRKERVLARTQGPEGRWIVISHISWRGERNTCVETFPTSFKALRESPK